MQMRQLPQFLWLLAILLPIAGANAAELTLGQIQQVFPGAEAITALDGKVPAYLVRGSDGHLGYAASTLEVAPVSAYSGKPIDSLVGIQPDGTIIGVSILHHEEPILVIGVSDIDLAHFVSQFQGKHAYDRVRVGAHARQGYVGIDGISGATITTMVLTSSVSKTARLVMQAYGTMPVPEVDESRTAASTLALEPESPAWRQLWEERTFELTVTVIALVILMQILFFQDWLVKRSKLFHAVRVGYLLFTVFFIGFYCSAQLSVINLLAFFHRIAGGFSWDTLLLEPISFVLWAFVAVSILLWGRGVYCGWLCPFGAAQDLISKLANKLGFEGYQLPQMVHERLWAIKYFILIALVGLSLDSMVNAARLAEVEPFKTVFVLRFMREPEFVFYAVALLLVSALNSKFYCKYICPLGAGLSFITKFRIFDWLRRRKDCGTPCQACAEQCQIAAIKPTGEIIDNECHYCLECQVTYWDDQRCPPLVTKRKKKEVKARKAAGIIASDP